MRRTLKFVNRRMLADGKDVGWVVGWDEIGGAVYIEVDINDSDLIAALQKSV